MHNFNYSFNKERKWVRNNASALNQLISSNSNYKISLPHLDKQGVDIIVNTKSESFNIDLKIRQYFYNDILIEYYAHCPKTKTKDYLDLNNIISLNTENCLIDVKDLGWALRPYYITDYIFYIIEPEKVCYVLDYKKLRSVILLLIEQNFNPCNIKIAENETFNTLNYAMKIETLQKSGVLKVVRQWK